MRNVELVLETPSMGHLGQLIFNCALFFLSPLSSFLFPFQLPQLSFSFAEYFGSKTIGAINYG